MSAEVLGPILVGSLMVYLLIGAYMVQLFHYLTNDCVPAARTQLHLLVGLVTTAEVIIIVFLTQETWRILVTDAQYPELPDVSPPTAPGIPILNGVVASTVECFFAWRIARLTRKRYVWIRYTIPAAIITVAFVQLAAAFTVGIRHAQLRLHGATPARLRGPITLYLSASLACDTLITLSMVFILLDFKAGTNLSTTKRLLNSLMLNAMENGAVTTICVALNLGFFIARPRGTIHLCFQFIVGRLYANILLANLNGRGRRAASASQDIVIGEEETVSSDFGREPRESLSTSRDALHHLTPPKLCTKKYGEGRVRALPLHLRLGKKRLSRTKSPSSVGTSSRRQKVLETQLSL